MKVKKPVTKRVIKKLVEVEVPKVVANGKSLPIKTSGFTPNELFVQGFQETDQRYPSRLGAGSCHSIDGKPLRVTYGTVPLDNKGNMNKPSHGCHAWCYSLCGQTDHFVTYYKGWKHKKEATAFFEWITSLNGPFKKLWEGGDCWAIYDEKGEYPKAISLGKHAALFKDWGVVMGLFIISRVPEERIQLMLTWYELVNVYNMEPALAYYMCRDFQKTTDKSLIGKWVYTSGGRGWCGAHEIFNETSGGVDVQRFANGEFFQQQNRESYLSGVVWNDPSRKRYYQFPFGVYGTKVKHGWAEIITIDTEQIPRIIADFTKYVYGPQQKRGDE